MMRLAAVFVAILLCSTPGFVLADEPPAALVMAIKGHTTPAMQPMSEIPSGKTLRLDPGTELTVLDYIRCKMVTVKGGTLTVTRFDFVADGTIVSKTKAPCPRIHRLRATSGTVAGGLVMRGLTGTPRWPLDRELIFVGDAADQLTGAAIYAAGKLDTPLVRLELGHRRARYPAGSPTLVENGHYVLRLMIAGRPVPEDIAFTGGAPSGPSLLVVLRR